MGKLIFTILILASQISHSAPASPKWEVRTAPLAFFVKWFTLDLSFFATENIAFGPSYVNYGYQGDQGNMFLPSYTGNAAGAHLIWADSFNKESFYVSSHFHVEDYKSYGHAIQGHDLVTGNKLSVDVGHRWIPWSNVSSMFGFGVEAYNRDITVVRTSSANTERTSNSAFFHIEYKLGYFF